MLNMVPTCSIDLSTFESRISSLEFCSELLDGRLSDWIAIVVIGVCLEIAVIIFDHIGEWRAWKRGTIMSREKPTIRKLLFHLSGAVLVAMGVGGEFAVHTKVIEVQSDLRIANHELVASKDREIRSAIVDTQTRTSAIGQEVSAGRARRVTSEQAKKLAVLLKSYRGRVVYIPHGRAVATEESTRFRVELRSALYEVVGFVPGHMEAGAPFKYTNDIELLAAPEGNELAEAIASALKAVGIISAKPPVRDLRTASIEGMDLPMMKSNPQDAIIVIYPKP